MICTGPAGVSTTPLRRPGDGRRCRERARGPRPRSPGRGCRRSRTIVPARRRAARTPRERAGRADTLHGEEVAGQQHQVGIVGEEGVRAGGSFVTGCHGPRCGSVICTRRSGRVGQRRRGAAPVALDGSAGQSGGPSSRAARGRSRRRCARRDDREGGDGERQEIEAAKAASAPDQPRPAALRAAAAARGARRPDNAPGRDEGHARDADAPAEDRGRSRGCTSPTRWSAAAAMPYTNARSTSWRRGRANRTRSRACITTAPGSAIARMTRPKVA